MVAAFAAVVRVLNFDQVEEFFPIRAFFLKRNRAIADFNPAGFAFRQEPGFAHVPQVLAFGDGPFAQGAVLYRFQQ